MRMMQWRGAMVMAAVAMVSSSSACILVDGGEGEGEGEGEDPCLPPSTVTDAFTITGDCDVEIPQGVDVAAGGTLTVEAGATLRFASGSGLHAGTDGTVVVNGTSDAPVTLRGTTAGWIGVDIESGSAANAITFATIQDAGGGSFLFGREAALQVRDGARLAVSDVAIVDSAAAGLSFFGSANATLARVSVQGSTGAAAAVDATAAHLLNDTVVLAGERANGIPRVVVEPVAFDADRTWQALDVPYELTDRLDIDGHLTLSPGVTILGRSDARLVATTDGALTATGTEEAHITLSPVQAGDTWGGVAFQGNTVDNALAFVDISGAGAGDILFQPASGAIYLEGGSRAALTSVTVTDTDGFALVLGDDDVSLTLTTSTFTGSSDGAVSLRANDLGDLTTGTTYSDGVFVRAGDVTDDATWAALGVTVTFAETVSVEGDVVIEDGADLAFASDVAIDVTTGALTAEDTDNTVQTTFHGVEATAGFWSGIFFHSRSVNNVIDGASIAHSGGTPVLFGAQCGVHVFDTASATVTDTAFSTIDGVGIHVDAGGQLTASGNTFSAISGVDVENLN